MNGIYQSAGQIMLSGGLNWASPAHPWAAALIDTAEYDVNLATHQYLSDIGDAAIVAKADLTNPTAVGGVASADPVTIPAVTGNTVSAIVIYQDTGTESTSPLICYLDDMTGLPLNPGGGDIALQWPTSDGTPLGIISFKAAA